MRNRVFQEIFYLGLSGCGVGGGLLIPFVNNVSRIQKRVLGTKTFVVSDSIEGWADSKSRRMIDTIYDKTLEVFRISNEQNIPVNKAADVMAEKRIESIKNIKNAYLGKTNFRMPGQKNRRG
jgi:hypothetical protein